MSLSLLFKACHTPITNLLVGVIITLTDGVQEGLGQQHDLDGGW